MSPRWTVTVALLAITGCSSFALDGGGSQPGTKGGSSLSWMGIYGDTERHDGANPGTFSVMMNQDYYGLQADLVIRVDGGDWERHDMDWAGHVDGNSLWQLEPADAFEPGASVEYFFHGYDSWGAQIWDSAGGANYGWDVPTGYAEHAMEPIDVGFWPDADYETCVWGYVDFAVDGWGADQRMAMQTRVLRENGAEERYLYHLAYEGTESDGRGRWGTDLIELYPDSVHHGAITAVDFTFQASVDSDGDGVAELLQSEHRYHLAAPVDLAAPTTGLGTPELGELNDDEAWATADTSLAALADSAFDDALPSMEQFFSPYDDSEQAVIAEIEAVIDAQLADPGGLHTIHASIFDVNDSRIADALIDAHHAGVEVKLLTAGYHMEPWRSWETEYPRLQAAGVPVLGVVRDEDIAASMHTKFAVFDGLAVATGSYNWEVVSADDNAEDMILIRSAELAAVYERMFAAVAAEPYEAWPVDSAAPIQVYYSQDHEIAQVVCEALDAAADTVDVAMFTLRSMSYTDASGNHRDVLDALIDAQTRGVDVRLILEENIADAGEYYGTVTDDDGTDEWLESYGIEVIEIDIDDSSNPYASMHHKYAVIDGEIALLGSANWSSMTQVSDDDLMVIHDTTVAEGLLGEITHLRHHYEDGFDPATAPSTPVEITVYHPHTSWGEAVHLVGDIDELGGWDSGSSIELDPSDWPRWTATVDLPAGTHFEFKAVVIGADGSVSWQSGDNIGHTADPGGASDPVFVTWAR